MTVRPRNGLTTPIEDALVKWLNTFRGSQMVIEGEAETRHAHIQIWRDVPATKGDINKQLSRVCQKCYSDWDSAQEKVLRTGTKIAYNDWIHNYCIDNDLKGESHIVLDNRPLDTDDFYPSEREQQIAQKRSDAVDQQMCKLEIMFEEWNEHNDDEPITETLVATFLCDMMCHSRKIQVVKQQRDRNALTRSLFHYITKAIDPDFCRPPLKTISEDRQFEKNLIDLGFKENEIVKMVRKK